MLRGGVESLVESMVSLVEAHITSSRGIIFPKRLDDATIVSCYGEEIIHCFPLVKEAMRAYTLHKPLQDAQQ